jgi:signal-transduction protein with cAMP-binding, CBS, and nucleotidyltransferase domain
MAVEPDQLRSCSLFTGLGHEELEPLCDWFEVASVSEGVTVAGEGAPGYSFFVIAQGNAVVTADGDGLATLGPGDFFGEVARSSAAGAAARPSPLPARPPLLVMFGTEFRRLQEAQPEVAARLEAAMADRA